MKIHVTVNGVAYDRDVEPRTLLAYFLREECRLTGTHVGCDTSSCGCCVVVLDGTRAVKSCTMFAAQADGHEILTVEGLAEGGKLHALQQGFWDQHGLQCGYCTPGMLLTAYALLKHPPPWLRRSGLTVKPKSCEYSPTYAARGPASRGCYRESLARDRARCV